MPDSPSSRSSKSTEPSSDRRSVGVSVAIPEPYTATETLQTGGRFRVVRARDEGDRGVVLKIPLVRDPATLQRLRNELERGRELADAFAESPELSRHRLAYLDLVSSHSLAFESRPVLVVEDVGGRSLDRDLPAAGLELERWLELAVQSATILRGIHRRGLIHKQVQPAHMILGEDGCLRFIGLGQSAEAYREHARAVPPRQLESSLAYLSPEQTGRMNRSVDYRSDFYSLGISLYQLLTGRLPFPTTDVGDLVHSHLAKEPPSPLELRPSLPVVVADVLHRLLAKNAEDRYQSASGLLRDLKRCLDLFRADGEIPAFPLARGEKPQQFQLPQKLYGREREVERLLDAFDRSRRPRETGVEMLLIEGAPGTGKSVLPLELYKPITRDRGHMVGGRFDPMRRDVPYSAWSRALSDLCRHILTEPPHSLESWRKRIREASGDGGAPALAELIPRLELILDAEPPSSTEAGPEAAHRLTRALRRLISAFADARHPLVIFLDNAHWADEESLHLLEELAAGEPIRHCLVLVSFDDRRTIETHPLRGRLERLEEAHGTPPEIVHLENLGRDHVARLVADALGAEISEARPLADLVHTKTDGNPHFVRQFLVSLHDQGLLSLGARASPDEGTEETEDDRSSGPISEARWTWDLEGARALSITDNVVELLTRRIDALPPESRDLLRLASCLGTSFELGALATVDDRGRGATLRLLGPCLQHHLVLTVAAPPRSDPGDGETVGEGSEEGETRWFRFSHDRVRQAAYGSIDEPDRRRMHLCIARRLHADDDELSRDHLFETLSHYLRAEPLVTEPAERARILELALAAGEKALAAAAYPTAADHLTSGVSVLEDDLRDAHPTLAFELERTCLQALGLATRFTEADALFESLERRCSAPDERLAICRLRLEQLTTRGLYTEALEVGAEALELLGTRLPPDEEACERELERDLADVPELLAGRSIEDLEHAPPLRDATQGRLLKVLGAVATCAFPSGRPMLVAWTGCRRLRIVLRHGLQPGDALAFTAFAYSTLIYTRRDYEQAFRYGRLAVRVVAGSPSLSARSRALVTHGGAIQHWCRPLAESLPHFRRALGYALESGDLIFAGYSVWFLFSTRFQTGAHLGELQRDARRRLAFLSRSFRTHLDGAFRPSLLQPIAHLLGETDGPDRFDGPDHDERAFLDGPGRSPYFRALYVGAKIRGLFWMGRLPEALELIEERKGIEEALYSQALLPEYLLFIGLTLTAAYDMVDEEDRALYDRILDDYQARFERWSELCPENTQHRLFLLSAERARLAEEPDKAARLYRQAIDVAASTGWIHYEGLAHELFGDFWERRGEPTAAVGYRMRARDLYARWGARAKVEHLESRHAELTAGGRQLEPDAGLGVGLDAELDLDHALRASRAISGEIRPDDLLRALMTSVVETAGARRGCLVLMRDGELTVEVTVRQSRGGGESAPLEVRVEPVPLAEYPDAARSVIHFVSRTGEDVVLGDASASSRFGADPRLVNLRIPSVLCLPMRRHGDLAGLLYLENRLAAHVFTAERVALLHTLLAQAAISLENAHLYDDLACEIQERKLAEDRLRTYNAELETKNTELERFAYTVSHDLRSPLVTIKGFLGLLEEDAEAGRLDAMREDIARISKATDHMSELLSDLLDLSRVGHLAGPFTEIPLLDLVQETLELLAIPLANAGIEIRMVPPFPVVYGDRVRLREVLQNLIENATKFMGEQERPQIEIGTRESDDDRPVVFVRDNGAGIDKDHQQVIFGLFQQLNQGIEGTGVGLTLVRRIVEAHGGKVWVESEGLGRGATFLFTLAGSGDEAPSREAT